MRLAARHIVLSEIEYQKFKQKGSKYRFGYEGRKFVAYFFFVGWDCISLGLHICVAQPNIEIHLPFGFIRIGRSYWRVK